MTVRGTIERGVLSAIGARVRHGTLTVVLPDGDVRTFSGPSDGPEAVVELRDPKLLRRLATLGAIGLADGYVAGDFESPDLPSVIELGAVHLEEGLDVPGGEVLERAGKGAWRALGRSAAPRGPLRRTVEHYDLGNDFFALWLDPSMTYSSAVFADDDMSLEDAQREKYRRLAEATGVRAGDEVLEIGCGWGGFSIFAAGELGCRVTAITVSREQRDHVAKLVAERGLADRIDVRLEDFRETTGTFDRVVSIEMIESIPKSLWAPYFGVLRDRVRPGGTIGLQIIVVADTHWRSSDRNPDFIRRYVFPGGQVPAPMVLRDLARDHGLAWREDHGYGSSYARTLGEWRRNFDARIDEVTAQGFDERFRRMWRYYLSYCEGGFRAGRTDVRQIVLER
ncbi:MAG TPA: cyclopropane-fatty-acyl-phospholipid synthase family protein [Actinomycetota bacterium]|nr:cyclopropane-fatty-acyl-phospholipid synthase family protein [Actinomycetota bacterium]